MTIPLEDRFQSFLSQLHGSEKIPHNRPNIKDGDKQADYLLCERKIVAEIKALSAPQRHKGESVIDDYLDETGGVLYGMLPLSRVVDDDEHLSVLEKMIARRMTRGIEKICKSADKQIGAEFNRLPKLATGLLILINEALADLHPREVADRVLEFAREKPTNIHYCLLIFESHKVRVDNRLLPYPLLLDLTYSARQRRAKPLLRYIQDRWARQNGFPDGLPSPEPAELEYHPNTITFGR